jgi:putative tricarboxylic transport membrane protein
MSRRDLLGSLFWLGISIFGCIESIRTGFGTFRSPGPGFFPFWSAVILGMFAVILLVISSLKKKRKGMTADPSEGMRWKKVIWVLFFLFVYPFVLPIVGYLLTTFGLMAFMLGTIGRSRAWVEEVTALVITLVSYVVFYFFLGIPLPKGILGF